MRKGRYPGAPTCVGSHLDTQYAICPYEVIQGRKRCLIFHRPSGGRFVRHHKRFKDVAHPETGRDPRNLRWNRDIPGFERRRHRDKFPFRDHQLDEVSIFLRCRAQALVKKLLVKREHAFRFQWVSATHPYVSKLCLYPSRESYVRVFQLFTMSCSVECKL